MLVYLFVVLSVMNGSSQSSMAVFTAGHAVSKPSTVLLGKARHRRFNLPWIKQKNQPAQIVQNCKLSGTRLSYSSILQCITKNQGYICIFVAPRARPLSAMLFNENLR